MPPFVSRKDQPTTTTTSPPHVHPTTTPRNPFSPSRRTRPTVQITGWPYTPTTPTRIKQEPADVDRRSHGAVVSRTTPPDSPSKAGSARRRQLIEETYRHLSSSTHPDVRALSPSPMPVDILPVIEISDDEDEDTDMESDWPSSNTSTSLVSNNHHRPFFSSQDSPASSFESQTSKKETTSFNSTTLPDLESEAPIPPRLRRGPGPLMRTSTAEQLKAIFGPTTPPPPEMPSTTNSFPIEPSSPNNIFRTPSKPGPFASLRLTEKATPAQITNTNTKDALGEISVSSFHRRSEPREPKPIKALPRRKSAGPFLNGRLGTDLDVAYISHSRNAQEAMDRLQIPWGVQWELSRGEIRGLWTWEEVVPKLGQLTGQNADAAFKVRSVMMGTGGTTSNLALWRELDREQLAINENIGRGLGLMGPWQGESDWHGGRIQQLARLVKEDGHGKYKIVLEQMEQRRCNRFARFLGSRRMIQVQISDKLVASESERLCEFLTKKFILCGRVFLPFHSKDNGVYMMETNEDFERQSGMWCGDDHRISFADFINWHNPLALNSGQPISKWSTRFALGLSNSVPVLEFEAENIFYKDVPDTDDIYAFDHDPFTKAPAEKIMTDGCGYINASALLRITRKLDRDSRPSAVQGRLGPAKGLWIVHPTDKHPSPRIWLRKSQTKIKLEEPFDRAHRIFDLLCISTPSSSVALSRQSILNLAYNGVPEGVLVGLLEDGLVDEVKPLTEWEGRNAKKHLFTAVSKIGNVAGMRTQRMAAEYSRVLGLQGRDWGREDVSDTEGLTGGLDEEEASEVYTGRNKYSKAPLSLFEVAYELVQAGFEPQHSKLLRDKLKFVVKQHIDTAVEQFRIPINQAIVNFMAPDPLGILEEGQIYYRSSQALKDPQTETLFNTLVGEVVMGRYPIRLPSDMQKVVAVDNPAYQEWCDVILVSTKGSRSLASLLSGGDYDGDDPFVIWDKAIVEPFQNQPFTAPPADLDDHFQPVVETVDEFEARAKSLEPKEAQKAFQKVLLLNINDSKVGLYSNFHDDACLRKGYGHEDSIRLAYLFATLLDSSKTGLRLRAGIFEKDQRAFSKTPIPHNHILGALIHAGNLQRELLCQKFEEYDDIVEEKDPVLGEPYNRLSARVMDNPADAVNMALFNELSLIRKHVNAVHDLWRVECMRPKDGSPSKSGSFSANVLGGGGGGNNTASSSKKKKSKKKLEDPMMVVTRKFAEPIQGGEFFFFPDQVEVVKASFAYELHQGFAFGMAFGTLCHMKATAEGIAPVTLGFDEMKTVSSSYVKAMRRAEDDHDW